MTIVGMGFKMSVSAVVVGVSAVVVGVSAVVVGVEIGFTMR